jgi:hypothetical protein
MVIAAIVVGGLLAVVIAGAGGSKLAGAPMMHECNECFGIPLTAYRAIGALEIAIAAGIIVGLWRIGIGDVDLSVAAGSCLFLLLVGGVATHVRAVDRH